MSISTERIAEEAALAADACFLYYTGRRMSEQTLSLLRDRIEKESPEESEVHRLYAEEYHRQQDEVE